MSIVNAVLRVVFDAALYPFRTLHPLVGLTLVSVVFGILALLAFKWTSDQEKLDAVKRRIHAGLFEIRLFNDDLGTIFRAMFAILRHNLTYIRLSLVPLAVMLPPFVLAAAQLQFHYGYEGLAPGDRTLLQVEMREDWQGDRPDVRLEVPAGLAVEVGPVWAPSLKELTWRIAAEEWGDYELVLHVGGETVTKTVQVSEGVVSRRSTVKPSSFVDQVLYPAEPPVPDSVPIARITLDYPPSNAGLLEGWESELTWFWAFLALSVVAALALRKPLGVTL